MNNNNKKPMTEKNIDLVAETIIYFSLFWRLENPR